MPRCGMDAASGSDEEKGGMTELSIVVWSVICVVAAVVGFIVGLCVPVKNWDEISWQQGYNRGWRDGMKQMQNENKKKDGENNE